MSEPVLSEAQFHAQQFEIASLYGTVREQRADIERLRERLRKYEPEHGVCEHGVPDGEWCAACNRLMKAAREEE